MISTIVTRASALLLAAAGLATLFLPDAVLGLLAPGLPPGVAWLGQLLASAWLAVAVLNWLQRHATLGGIYGRPTVLANLALYGVSSLALLGAARHGALPRIGLLILVPTGLLAIVYGILLLRGPFDGPARGVRSAPRP